MCSVALEILETGGGVYYGPNEVRTTLWNATDPRRLQLAARTIQAADPMFVLSDRLFLAASSQSKHRRLFSFGSLRRFCAVEQPTSLREKCCRSP